MSTTQLNKGKILSVVIFKMRKMARGMNITDENSGAPGRVELREGARRMQQVDGGGRGPGADAAAEESQRARPESGAWGRGSNRSVETGRERPGGGTSQSIRGGAGRGREDGLRPDRPTRRPLGSDSRSPMRETLHSPRTVHLLALTQELGKLRNSQTY